MPYVVSKLAIALISPLGTALALGVLGFLLLRAARRIAMALMVIAFGWLVIWSIPAFSDALRHEVEARYPARSAETLPVADAILVLGGAMAPPSGSAPYADLTEAGDRVWHAARLFRAGKAPLVVVSGGSDPAVSRFPEAEAIRALLVDLGVPPGRIVLESRSRNTRENAQFTAPLLREYRVSRVLLVTSALHMERAVAEFRQAGVEVIPAATDHLQETASGVMRWVPDAGALDRAARTMKEIVGLWMAPRT